LNSWPGPAWTIYTKEGTRSHAGDLLSLWDLE